MAFERILVPTDFSPFARYAVDHAVGPVPHTVGGSMAGQQRWRRFRDDGLAPVMPASETIRCARG